MRALTAAALALALGMAPATACSLSLGTPGVLALNGDGTVLASDVGLGLPATATLLLPALSGTTVDIAPPTRIQTPGGYNGSAELLEVRYTAAGLLGPIATQGYVASTTSFPVNSLLAALSVTITLHNRISNANGFAAGTYGTRTIITCHP